MPLYGYTCSKCDRRVEEHRKIEYRDVPPMTCPSCGSDKTFSRETASPAFILQGSGWHSLEYNKHRRRKD